VENKLLLTLHESEGIPRRKEHIQIGIPLQKGEFDEVQQVQLLTKSDALLLSAKTATAYWSDKSIKWCLVMFSIDLEPNEIKEIYLIKKVQPETRVDRINPVTETRNSLVIKTKNTEFHLNMSTVGWFEKILYNNELISSRTGFEFTSDKKELFESSITEYSYQNHYANAKPVITEVFIKGLFYNAKEAKSLLVNFNYVFYLGCDTVKCTIIIHNPEAALHENGLWDLGDNNSIYFSGFKIFQDLETPPVKTHYRTSISEEWQTTSGNSLSVYQESSGGENWNNLNHKNRFNEVPLKLKGYRLDINDKTTYGERASPVFSINTAHNSYFNIRVKKFWQNFPKCFYLKSSTLSIELFPDQFPDIHELQPGEKKTHDIYFALSEEMNDLSWVEHPVEIAFSTSYLQKTQAIPGFDVKNNTSEIQNIIKQGIKGDNSFFLKREKVDEYGWRNFGDIFADHETLEHPASELFASHYNNQYDPLHGFLQQYLLTGQYKWFELADDLAKHITDIDIYHTSEDKDEYNHGLFWHTDHYAPAETSSHRTYSKYQPKEVYQNHAGGGGPGGQHCYTTGLAVHYLLTGYEPSRLAVHELTDWIKKFYEGNGTLGHFILALKNSSDPGLKNLKNGQYPLDRGTGNYIVALLDSHLLSGKQAQLDEAGLIIKNTIHPDECIEERNLGDVENSWFYTVFLQAVIRFLDAKEKANQIDSAFYYARDALLKYVGWMVEYESPYLHKPEILEYPNSTWAAQDIRKALIFKSAIKYNTNMADTYLARFNYFFDYTNQALKDDKTNSYTRILSILMQNLSYKSELAITHPEDPELTNSYHRKHAGNSYSILRTFIETARNTSLKAELKWLDKRIPWRLKFYRNHGK